LLTVQDQVRLTRAVHRLTVTTVEAELHTVEDLVACTVPDPRLVAAAVVAAGVGLSRLTAIAPIPAVISTGEGLMAYVITTKAAVDTLRAVAADAVARLALDRLAVPAVPALVVAAELHVAGSVVLPRHRMAGRRITAQLLTFRAAVAAVPAILIAAQLITAITVSEPVRGHTIALIAVRHAARIIAAVDRLAVSAVEVCRGTMELPVALIVTDPVLVDAVVEAPLDLTFRAAVVAIPIGLPAARYLVAHPVAQDGLADAAPLFTALGLTLGAAVTAVVVVEGTLKPLIADLVSQPVLLDARAAVTGLELPLRAAVPIVGPIGDTIEDRVTDTVTEVVRGDTAVFVTRVEFPITAERLAVIGARERQLFRPTEAIATTVTIFRTERRAQDRDLLIADTACRLAVGKERIGVLGVQAVVA